MREALVVGLSKNPEQASTACVEPIAKGISEKVLEKYGQVAIDKDKERRAQLSANEAQEAGEITPKPISLPSVTVILIITPFIIDYFENDISAQTVHQRSELFI